MLLAIALSSLSLAASLSLVQEPQEEASIGPRVRGANHAVKAFLEKGARRSPTLARLMREIDATDLVVYVEITGGLPPGIDGRLAFLTCAGGVRYLRVQVSNVAGPDEMLSVLGHELQHALEVAENPGVRDSTGLATLYMRIGIQGTISNRYDTAAAQIIGRRVRAEL